MGWFLPFIAFATIDIYFCIFSMLPMCNIGMWIQYKCDPKEFFTIVYLRVYNINITYTNAVVWQLTNKKYLLI